MHWLFAIHTPPEAMLRKIKCPGQTANAGGSQLLIWGWGHVSQLFWMGDYLENQLKSFRSMNPKSWGL